MPMLGMAIDLARYNGELTLRTNDNLVLNIMIKQLIKYMHDTV